ncbi:MAG: His/Gly/Thr/Pro-type tRNA ligase C-terminal domain-containing protein, partial [bacterium]
LKRLLAAETLQPADAETIERLTSAPVGFAGPVGLPAEVTIVMDTTVSSMRNFITGGNRKDLHIGGVNHGRDFTAHHTGDIRFAADGDACPRCEDGRLEFSRGIEVGHVFKLGTKYSRSMKLEFAAPDGSSLPVVMGCYGIGVGRTMAAAVEQSHDENGIIWHPSIAPYLVDIIPINVQDAKLTEAAERLYNQLTDSGIEVILDDRDERPGVKFKDADLIGFPLRIVFGKSYQDGKLELQVRKTGEKFICPENEILNRINTILKNHDI